MNFLQKISESAGRFLESNEDEVIVFLAVFLFIFLGGFGDRDADAENQRIDSGTIVFLIAFVTVLLLGSNREENSI
ncbi:MAG TPA: hypothetical protein VHP38_11225 [Ruminiclostridium sp.]|nr:hypothetical protein [Ruminiclostridium sp.]